MKLQNNFFSAGNSPSVYSPINSFLIPNFLNLQRSSFQEFLKNGLITEFQKYNPIKNSDKTIEIFFHANHYKLHQPKWTPKQAILKRKSYSCPLFMPIQLTNLKTEESSIQWLFVANLPLMTKHGHFILNGSPRVIMNQMVRSPGVYFKKTKNTSKKEVYYADFIAQRGAWLRLEVDTKTGDIWAKLKKTPKIPIFLFLRSLGLSLPILNSFIDLIKLRYLFQLDEEGKNKTNLKLGPFSEDSVKTPQLKFLLEDLRDVLEQRLNKKKATAQKKLEKAERKRIREYVKANRDKEREFSGSFKKERQVLEVKKRELEKDILLRSEELKLKEKKQSKDEEQHDEKMSNLIATKKKKQEYKTALTKARRALNWERKEIEETAKEVKRTVNALKKHQKNWVQKVVPKLLRNEKTNDIFRENQEKKFKKFQRTVVKRGGQFANPKDFLSVIKASRISDVQPKKGSVSFFPKKKERDFLYIDQGKSLSDLSDKLFPFLPEKTEREEGFIENPIAKAQKFLFRKFLNSRTYDFSPLGRLRINKKLGISIPLQTTTLTAQDVIFTCFFLMDLIQGERTSDDIDDLKNRKIKPSGDLVQTQLAIGLSALEKRIQEKFQEPETKSFSFADLVNIASRPINQSFREFFGTSPLSQLMDETNPLAELTHKRRLSSLGPGGIERETAGMSIRGIHPTHYGRICPIETPEGQNAGLVNSITTYAQFNKKGFLETPFYKAYKGFILKNMDPFLLSSDQENLSVLAPGDIPFSKFHFVPKNIELPARYLKEFKRVGRNKIDFISLSPIQMISVATSLIPFLEHDDGNRALMGSNMQRQAISTLRLSKPIVGTGLESRVISDVGHNLQAKKSGFISYVDGKQIHIYSKKEEAELQALASPGQASPLRKKRLKKNFFENSKPKTLFQTSTPACDRIKDESRFFYNQSANNLTLSKYDLDSYFRSNQDTYTVHRPLVKEGQWVEKGDSLADGSSSKQGELALGQNLLVGYTPWEGYNFEDAVLISERVVFDDVYTSLHIERYELEVRDTSYGLEQITNQIPNTFSESDYLDDNGIAKIGTWVKENDILVGKITPLDEKKNSPYRDLLYDIIGKERPKTRDTSLRVPKGVSGRVIHIEILETVDKNKAYPAKLSSNLSQKDVFASKSEGKSQKNKAHLSNASTKKTPELSFFRKPLSRTLAFATAQLPSKNFVNKSFQPTSKIVLKTISPGIVQNIDFFFNLRFAAQKKRKTKPFLKGTYVTASAVLRSRAYPERVTTKAKPKRNLLNCQYEIFFLTVLQKKLRFLKCFVSSKRAIKTTPSPFIFGNSKTICLNSLFEKRVKLLKISTKFDFIKKNTKAVKFSLPRLFSKSHFLQEKKLQKLLWLPRYNGNKCRFDFCKAEKADSNRSKLFTQIAKASLFENQCFVWPKRSEVQLTSWELFLGQRQKSFSLLSSLPLLPGKGLLRKSQQSLRSLPHNKLSTNSLAVENFAAPFALAKGTSKKISKSSPKMGFVRLPGDLPRSGFVTNPTKDSQKSSYFVALPSALVFPLGKEGRAKDKKKSPTPFLSPVKVHIYLAEKRKLQLGDKIAGRHGNKGIVSNILPRQDMPYLPDGTPLDIVLNPLGVPSRMNVGQIFECLLGLAGYYLKQNYKIRPFDEIYGSEASRSLVYSKLYEARCRTGQSWLFNPNFPGKIRLFDGRTGECFQQPITVGVAYILKLVHLVDHKIHARSTGPYSLVTQQPLRGRSKQGGQRVGEMEVWALEGFGAAYILQEILTVKSDDLEGRDQILRCILQNEPIKSGIPESFKVLVRELQSLCLDIVVFKASKRGPTRLNIEKFPKN